MQFGGWANVFVQLFGIGTVVLSVWLITKDREKLGGLIFFVGVIVMLFLADLLGITLGGD
jgi:hypothetical protein